METGIQIAMAVAGIAIAVGIIPAINAAGFALLGSLDASFDKLGAFANKAWFMNNAAGAANTFVNLAYALAVLYFLIELIGQVIALDKITPEIIVRMLVKLFIAKIMIDTAPAMCEAIYNTFHSIPVAGIADNLFTSEIPKIGPGILFGGDDAAKGIMTGLSVVSILVNAIVTAIAIASRALNAFILPLGIVTLVPILIFLIVTFMLVGQYVTLYIRYIEIALLTILSPLAMAGAASGEFKSVTKKFLLSFAAVCLQGIIIVLGAEILGALMPDPTVSTSGAGSIYGNFDNYNMFASLMYGISLIMKASMFTMLIGKSRSFANAVLQG